MNNQSIGTSLTKAILSGLLTGVIAAIVNLVYTIAYREISGFDRANIIMPMTLFIGLPILLTMAGFAYYLIKRHMPFGTRWFFSFCILLLIALIFVTIGDTSGEEGTPMSGLRGLCLGLEVITCILAAFFIPYFANHPDLYE